LTLLQRLARGLGYDLTPAKKAKSPNAQLTAFLKHHRIDTVLDVGANVGQYGQRLRDWGYEGRIISFEPLSTAHQKLGLRSAPDQHWTIAPRMAIGAENGEVEIQVSAETDMSSILPQSDLMKDISPTSMIEATERVPIHRLENVAPDYISADDRVFLKIDTQGFEPKVLDGAGQLLPHLIGLQLEMSLLPIYEGESDYLAMIQRLGDAGFKLHLVIPGYFERKLARQLEIDGVFIRDR